MRETLLREPLSRTPLHRIGNVAAVSKGGGGALPRNLSLMRWPADHEALRHVHDHGGVLCTIVRIEGSYSRALGAQLAIAPDGSCAGDLANHCLEEELVRQAGLTKERGVPALLRYGQGSPVIDYRLPCGSTLEILIDPAPARDAIAHAIAKLDSREVAHLKLEGVGENMLRLREYRPGLRIALFGQNSEAEEMVALSLIYGAEVICVELNGLSSPIPKNVLDKYSAAICLFHDHEWERAALPQILLSDAFYVGAIGGARMCKLRKEMLIENGVPPAQMARVRGPIGLVKSTKNARSLAVSTMAEVVQQYEQCVAR